MGAEEKNAVSSKHKSLWGSLLLFHVCNKFVTCFFLNKIRLYISNNFSFLVSLKKNKNIVNKKKLLVKFPLV